MPSRRGRRRPRRKKNLINALQFADTGLSAASLAIVLKYQYGDIVSEKDIVRDLSSRSEYAANPELVKLREGFSLSDLKRYVDNRGYRGIGYGRLRFTDLVEKAPILVPINPGGFSRLVVFRGAIKDIVLLADPLRGSETMLRDDFENAWIDYGQVNQDMGKIGFVVAPGDRTAPPHQLGPTASALIIDIIGFAELLLSNANGEKIGFNEGKYIDQIPDAERFDYAEDDRYLAPLGDRLLFYDKMVEPLSWAYQTTRDPRPPPLNSRTRYYFSQDTTLTAEVSGTAAGAYDLVKTKGDAIVKLLNVPTAETVKDTVFVSEVGELSIKFGSGSNRDGRYDLSVSKNLDEWAKFEAHNLRVMSRATITYQIDWEALRAGENGVTIKVDNNSDGNIDFKGTVGAELDDAVAPTTTPDLSGIQLPTGSYLLGAALRLVATDNNGGIGVDKTEYSLDNGSNWTSYTAPLVFNEAGQITLAYRSRDGLGNLEATQSLTFTIATPL